MKSTVHSKILELPADEHDHNTGKQKRIKLANSIHQKKIYNNDTKENTSAAGYFFNSIKSLFSDDSSTKPPKKAHVNTKTTSSTQLPKPLTEPPLILDLSDPSQIISFLKSRSKRGIAVDPSTMSKILPNLENICELNKQYERTIKSLEKEQQSRSKVTLKTLQHPSYRKNICEKSMMFNGALREQIMQETTQKRGSKEESMLTKTDLEQLQTIITRNIEKETQSISENINKVKDKIAVLLENNLKNNFEEIKSPRKQPQKKNDDLSTRLPNKEDFSYEEEFAAPVKNVFSSNKPNADEEQTKKVKGVFNKGTSEDKETEPKKVTFKEPEKQGNEIKNMFSFGKPEVKKEETKKNFSFGKPEEKGTEHKEEVKNMFSFGKPEQSAPVFSFGPNKTIDKPPIFNFGGVNKEKTEAPKTVDLFSSKNNTNITSQPSVFNFNAPSKPAGNAQVPTFNFGANSQTTNQQPDPIFNFNQPTTTTPVDIFAGGHRDYGQSVDLFSNAQPSDENNDRNNSTFSLGQLNSSDSVNKRRIFRAKRN